jgi:hypothetical protein
MRTKGEYMYSLIITVKSIEMLSNFANSLIHQYEVNVHSTLKHGEEYLIPSLRWPPPPLVIFLPISFLNGGQL